MAAGGGGGTVSAAFFFLLGLVFGGLAAWLLAELGRARLRRDLQEQLERSLPQITEAAFANKTQQLGAAAAQELKLAAGDTVHRVTQSQTVLEQKLEAMQQRLEAYQAKIADFEKERAAADAAVKAQLEAVARAGAAMEQESRTLRQALAASSGVRGKWGEQVLANILERCGLNDGVDYDLQETFDGPDGALRPDAVIHLPTGLNVPVDAKASLTDFLAGLEQADEGARQEHYRNFARVLRERAKQLARKDYSGSVPGSAPFVVMFVPSEAALRAALDADAGLLQFAQGLTPSIALASPSTLFPILALIAQGWRQHRAVQQAGELLREVAEFGKRIGSFLDHVQAIGKGLDAAGKAYNQAVGSYRQRLAPQARKLEELHAGWEALPELKPVENRPLLAESAAAGEPRD